MHQLVLSSVAFLLAAVSSILSTAAGALITVGALDAPASARAVAVVGGIAYVADSSFSGGSSLRIIDVSNPAAPAELGAFDTSFQTSFGVDVIGGLAYMAGGSSGLRVIDVSNPAALVELGFRDTLGSAEAELCQNSAHHQAALR